LEKKDKTEHTVIEGIDALSASFSSTLSPNERASVRRVLRGVITNTANTLAVVSSNTADLKNTAEITDMSVKNLLCLSMVEALYDIADELYYLRTSQKRENQ
jgi:hypothetical protein